MAESIVQSTLRVTVDGPTGRVDLAVPIWADIQSICRSYMAEAETDEFVTLLTSTGNAIDPSATVQRLGLRHGDVLVAAPKQTGGRHSAAGREEHTFGQRDAPPTAQRIAKILPLVAALCALLAAWAATLAPDGPARPVCAAVLLGLAFFAPLIPHSDLVDLRAWVMTSPVFAVAAIMAATADSGPGGILLTTGAIGLGAAASAAYARAMTAEVADEELLVWLYAGTGTAIVAVGGLLIEASSAAVWAALLVASIMAARLLPSQVVDVPDHVLLDFQRLAITAWSAREKPRRPRRGIVRRDDVAAVARRGRALVGAGAIAAAVIGSASAVLLLLAVDPGAATIGARIMVVAAGVSYCLGAHMFRARTPRTVLRLAGAVILLFALGRLLVDGDTSVQPLVAVAATLVGALVAFVAMVMGRGWRSVWWARIGEIVDAMSVVAVVACIPLATGFFDAMRQLTSS